MFAIGRRFNRTLQQLIEANKLLNPNIIVNGQILKIPDCLTPQPTVTHSPTP
jgi:LysM repeat protein